MHEKTSARVVRGLVKALYIGCYAAFLWASIHHVAAFFNDFEGTAGNTLGSYALAAAFDVTALITTIGVMFFRKSMPRKVQGIVWAFIIGIAIYSFLMNWEYTSHYQSASLILQPTGETTPVYDVSGILHYVPVMHANMTLLSINPALASGFTIFALIYSIIAEFFGTKPPTIEELQARKHYLEETSAIIAAIHQLEAQQKKPGLIQWGKGQALEIKSAVKEVVSSEKDAAQNSGLEEEIPSVNQAESSDQNSENGPVKMDVSGIESEMQNGGNVVTIPGYEDVLNAYPKIAPWLTSGLRTVPIDRVITDLHMSRKKLNHRLANGTLKTAPRNQERVTILSLLELLKTEMESHQKEPITRALPAIKIVQNGHKEASMIAVKADEKAS